MFVFLFFLRSYILSYVLSLRSRFRCTFLFLLASPSTHILHYNVSSLYQCLLFSFFLSPVFCLFPSIFHSTGSLLWSFSSSFFRLCLFISRYSIVCSLFSSIYLSLFSFLLYVFHTFDVRYFVIFCRILFFAWYIQSSSFVIHFSPFPVLRSFAILRYPFLCAKKLLLSSVSSNIAR